MLSQVFHRSYLVGNRLQTYFNYSERGQRMEQKQKKKMQRSQKNNVDRWKAERRNSAFNRGNRGNNKSTFLGAPSILATTFLVKSPTKSPILISPVFLFQVTNVLYNSDLYNLPSTTYYLLISVASGVCSFKIWAPLSLMNPLPLPCTKFHDKTSPKGRYIYLFHVNVKPSRMLWPNSVAICLFYAN